MTDAMLWRMPASLASRPLQHRRHAPDAPPAVLLIDDHDLFRAGLRQLLTAQGLRVVGDCRCGDALGELARRSGANIAVIDVETLDGTTTAPLIHGLTHAAEPIDIVVFGTAPSRVDLYRSVMAGARACVRKTDPIEHLAQAIRSVHEGGAWLDSELLTVALDLLRSGDNPTTPVVEMSERELEVIRLVAAGLENTEIADRLGISAKTAKNHVSNILAKLQLANRVQAAVWAVRNGIA